ncbi:MAG: divalent metal cation transporter [Rhodanobacteraceae bacterium]
MCFTLQIYRRPACNPRNTLGPMLGATAAGVFLVALIASGISSSVVGTLAGQMVMQGLCRFFLDAKFSPIPQYFPEPMRAEKPLWCATGVAWGMHTSRTQCRIHGR